MDTTTVLVFVLIAVIVVAFALLYRRRGRVRVKGPLNTELELDGSNDPAPGVRGRGLHSRAGGVRARDDSGRGVDLAEVEAKGDIELHNSGGPSPNP